MSELRHMPTDPNPDNWQRWWSGGFALGGFVGAFFAKWHSRIKGPSEARFKDLVDRIDQLEVDRDTMDRNNQRALGAITHELREIRARLP